MVAPITEFRGLIRGTVLADVVLGTLLTGFYDNAPAGAVSPYITFGESEFDPRDPTCITAGIHTLQLDVWSEKKARRECEDICFAVKGLLHLRRHSLVRHAITNVTARFQIFKDPDGITNHGVIAVQAYIEEN
ncbi:MAG: DUF3168 domain-containing protein [Gammaproteobacteria bacterium]|nr:DUF3168 domain-containing protein [Gammaproteobacteria bacterium]